MELSWKDFVIIMAGNWMLLWFILPIDIFVLALKGCSLVSLLTFAPLLILESISEWWTKKMEKTQHLDPQLTAIVETGLVHVTLSRSPDTIVYACQGYRRGGPHPSFNFKHICAGCVSKRSLLDFCDHRNRNFPPPVEVNTIVTTASPYIIDPTYPNDFVNYEPVRLYRCNVRTRECEKIGHVCFVRHTRQDGHILLHTIDCQDNRDYMRQ